MRVPFFSSLWSSRPVSRYAAGALLCLPLFVYAPMFEDAHHLPRLCCFAVVATLGAWLLAFGPGTRHAAGLGIALVVASISMALAVRGHRLVAAGLVACQLLSGFFYWVLVDAATVDTKRAILRCLWAAALLQAVVAVVQGHVPPDFWGATAGGEALEPVAFVGNREFLATLLAVGVLISPSLAPWSAWGRKGRMVLVGTGLLLCWAILLTRSKGTIGFLLGYGAWRVARWPGLVSVLAGLGASLVYLTPESVRGRLLLWIASGEIFLSNMGRGVGPAGFEGAYIEAIKRLFSFSPELKSAFGPHTAAVLDAHNLVLNSGALFGGLGLGLSVWFLIRAIGGVLGRADTLEDKPGVGPALALLVFKCGYTVVLGSVTSLLVFVLLLGCCGLKTCGAKDLRLGRRHWVAFAALATVLTLRVGQAVRSEWVYSRGLKDWALGREGQAQRKMAEALDFNDEHVEAHMVLGHIHFLQSETESMNAHLTRAMKIAPGMDTIKRSAHMYFYERRYAQAESLYKEILEVYPQHLTSMVKLALIYAQAGKTSDALLMAKRTLSVTPRVSNESDARNQRIARQLLADHGDGIWPVR